MFGTPQVYGRDQLVVQIEANSASAGANWETIEVPEWARLCHIVLWGSGGSGGNGVVGANSTAAGGGGGGSSGQTSVWVPTYMLPKLLYASIGAGLLGANGIASRVATYPNLVANHQLAVANGGSGGGNASGGTAGAAGGAGAIATIATMPLAAAGAYTLLAGQAGIIGGTTVAGAQQNPPTTGLRCMGGTGGGGLPAAATAGRAGGLINNSFELAALVPGGIGAAATTTPGGAGSHGFEEMEMAMYFWPGTGGGSSHGSAVGAGLVGGRGGDGSIGCGGGGGGGALTGSTQGIGGRGGDGRCIITFM